MRQPERDRYRGVGCCGDDEAPTRSRVAAGCLATPGGPSCSSRRSRSSSRQGYHAAAMDDIAERAGVSKPVLYQHFPGKLELYLALLDQSCDTIIEASKQALASTDDNKQRVTATMQVFYDYVASAQGAFRLVFESDLTNESVGARARRPGHPGVRRGDRRGDPRGHRAPGRAVPAARRVAGGDGSGQRTVLAGHRPARSLRRTRLRSCQGLAWRGIRGYPRTDEQA